MPGTDDDWVAVPEGTNCDILARVNDVPDLGMPTRLPRSEPSRAEGPLSHDIARPARPRPSAGRFQQFATAFSISAGNQPISLKRESFRAISPHRRDLMTGGVGGRPREPLCRWPAREPSWARCRYGHLRSTRRRCRRRHEVVSAEAQHVPAPRSCKSSNVASMQGFEQPR